MRKFRLSFFAVLLLTACSSATQTAPPQNAVDTAVAQTVAAWTAQAPTPTDTPVPTSTQIPTDTPVPRYTLAPTQTADNGCPEGCTYHKPGCDIKGNISINTGEKIYHMPGQEYYEETIIRPEYGERWFCTEAEARANGWRKSKR